MGVVITLFIYSVGVAAPAEEVSIQWVALDPSPCSIGQLFATILQVSE
jgi:hypothetical protein